MAYAGFEPVLLEQGALKGQERGFRDLYGSATPLADQVVMVSLVGIMIAKSPATQVGLGHQIKILQKLQGAIDGGDIYMWVFDAHLSVDLLGADVVIALLESGQDELALRGQPVTQFPQSFACLFRPLQSLHRIL